MGFAVFRKAAVDAVGSSAGATADVGGVDVEDVQRLGLKALSSLRG